MNFFLDKWTDNKVGLNIAAFLNPSYSKYSFLL